MLALRVDPRPVAIARIGLALAAMINTLELFVILMGLAAGKLAMPLFDWVPPVTSQIPLIFLSICIVATVALALGVAPQIAAAVYSVTAATVMLWDQQTYSSHQILVILLMAYLAFTRSDRAYSIVRRPGPREHVPWWPQLLMMTQLTSLYLFAGLSKINPEFLSGEPLSGWIDLPLPEWVFQPLAIATVVTEVLILPIGLWLARTRVAAALVGVGLHLSIVVMLADGRVALTAFALACVPLYPLFLSRPGQAQAAETGSVLVAAESP